MQTVGDYLKKEREARNISLNDIAQSTKISKMYLDCLEKDDYKKIPGEPYVKGYISSYAECVGINEHEALERYATFKEKTRHLQTPDEKPQVQKIPIFPRPSFGRKFRRALAFAVIAVLAGGTYYSVFQYPDRTAGDPARQTPDSAPRPIVSKTDAPPPPPGSSVDPVAVRKQADFSSAPQNGKIGEKPGRSGLFQVPEKAQSSPPEPIYKEGVYYPPAQEIQIARELPDSQNYQAHPQTDVTVVEAAACSEIENRAPQGCGRSFEWPIDRVYIWSRVQCESPPASIRHIYYFKGELVNEVTLKINAAHWRTWSYKTFLDRLYVGPWRVDIRSVDGELLKSVKFEIL
jgi:cytoskeletal protein RodZ